MKRNEHFNWATRISSYRVVTKNDKCAKCGTYYDVLVRVGFAGWQYKLVCHTCFEALCVGRKFDATGAEVGMNLD